MAITHGGDIFAIAREHGWDWREVLDFSANINPLGPAKGVRTAICGAVDRIVHYPEREPSALKQSLARKWQVESKQILLGNGATELIFFLTRALSPKQVTLAVPVFSEFHRAMPQAALVDLNAADYWPSDGLLVLTRPANPTGYSFPLEALERRLHRSAAPVIVDESFLEFSGLPSATTLLKTHPQLIILRSLT
jgi:threonine-phosphate decarboxylase